MKKANTPFQAVEGIRSGQRIFIHGQAAAPCELMNALFSQAGRLKDVELIHLHLSSVVPYHQEAFRKSFKVANLFVGPSVRDSLDYDHVDYLPCFLSEVPSLFRSKKRPIDVALINISPPDKHGYCSLGVSVDIARAAVDVAGVVIAQVNPNMPRVHGDGFIHISEIHTYIEVDTPILETPPTKIGPVETKIGEHVASLVEDGATLQIGIGSVPDAILGALGDHRHLGIHTEMWSDSALALIEKGVVDNSQKKIHRGKTVSGFMVGTQKLYQFVHDNPSVVQLDIGYVNFPGVIAQNPKVTAINSAVEVDLTGQVCADSIGTKIISGVGGQMDFMRGAVLSEGGKPIIALPSRTKQGLSRIVPTLKNGAGVVTTRGHVHYVVTEYGIVDLYGKTLNERSQALISIAHPEDREALRSQWHELLSTICV